MTSFLDFYQNLPSKIDPIAFSIGSFSVRWYSLMYLLAFVVVYFLLIYRIKNNETEYNRNIIIDFLIYAFVGLLIGARLGYVLFYNLPYFLNHPLEMFLPIQAAGYGFQVTGISGMSYYGGLAGIILAGYIFCRKNNLDFLRLTDFVIPAVPAGYFFGRVGNFLNGELFGRVTEKSWGMYFADGILRHPSQLYEAFFEGLVLFAILWIWRNKVKFSGQLLLIYFFFYGFLRFFIEFFREPDLQIGLIFNFLTLGQFFSLFLIIISIIFYSRRDQSRTVLD